MDFDEALSVLGISEYKSRIINSNSHGEIFHLSDYFVLADIAGNKDWFPVMFKAIVIYAEGNWERPESVFQHVLEIIRQQKI